MTAIYVKAPTNWDWMYNRVKLRGDKPHFQKEV